MGELETDMTNWVSICDPQRHLTAKKMKHTSFEQQKKDQQEKVVSDVFYTKTVTRWCEE